MATNHLAIRDGALVLADGSTFEGELIGAEPGGGVTSGEVVFNTVMSGYQEVISDPSYAGQIITFTTAHLGNYGVTPADDEGSRVWCRGVVLRDLARRRSSWRSDGDLDEYLRRAGAAGIAGVDTRRLTRALRDGGSMPGAFGSADQITLKVAAIDAASTDGLDLVTEVSCRQSSVVAGAAGRTIVAVDCGIKTTIVRCLAEIGTVHIVPSATSAADIMALHPDGVFLSNGPADPAAVQIVPDTIRSLLGEVPIFGICMGHQLLATALGGTTYKLPFGHHGGNHPVRDLETGRIEIPARTTTTASISTGRAVSRSPT